ncbi:hypothetical protein D3C71_1657840 [compost metagenome]
MAFGEDFINVLFHGPRRAHPPAGHLVNDHVGPEKLGHFFGDVVALVDEGGFDIHTTAIQHAQRGFMQGGVVAAVGVRKFFAAIEQQDFFHGRSREGRESDGGRVPIDLTRSKRRFGKIHLTYKHESTGDCCLRLAPVLT